MEVTSPRRALAVTLEGAEEHLSRVVKELTGSLPQQTSTSLAGTTHDLTLKTSYYTATVPVWIDLIANPDEWATSFLSDEAKEVLAVLGALILVFPVEFDSKTNAEDVRQLIRHVGRVVDKGLGGWGWDGVLLAVGVGGGDADEWDELCAEASMEFVQVGGSESKLNEFGEKTGIARVQEALESNDWSQLDEAAVSDFGDFQDSGQADEELDPEKLDFGYDPADFEGLRKAIWTSGQEVEESTNMDSIKSTTLTEDNVRNTQHMPTSAETEPDDDDVIKVEQMMRKLQAVREAGEGMSEVQRRRMAARAVEDVMKEL